MFVRFTGMMAELNGKHRLFTAFCHEASVKRPYFAKEVNFSSSCSYLYLFVILLLCCGSALSLKHCVVLQVYSLSPSLPMFIYNLVFW